MTDHLPEDSTLDNKISVLRFFRNHYILIIAIIGCIEGLFFVYAIPPWQHYDEPTHFEYAWLIANKNHFPALNEYDQKMRREVAASMISHNFFNGLSFRPDLESINEPIWIGITQTNDPPLYYFLVSFPLRLFTTSDITFQLYVARLVSLFFYLITILLTWKVMLDLTPNDHPLRWMVPFSLVVIPGIPDLMTSVNNDVGATLFFTLFLWMVVRFLNNKFSWPNLILLLTVSGFCFWTKNAVVIAPIIAILLLILHLPNLLNRLFLSSRDLRLFGTSWSRILFVSGILTGVVFLISFFRWGDPAYWYHQPFMNFVGRAKSPDAPLGSFSIQIPYSSPQPQSRMIQVIPVDICRQLRGKTVTLGAWIWASKPIKTRTPIFEDPDNAQSEFILIDVDTKPIYFSTTFSINLAASRAHILLSPHVKQNSINEEINVFYDGIVLTEGDYSSSKSPIFLESNGNQGRWGELAFSNLLHNGSAEQAWPGIRTWADNFISKYAPIRPSLGLNSILFPSSASWYYREAFQNIFFSFWGKFGWGNVPLFGNHTYFILSVLSIITLLFFVFAGIKYIRILLSKGSPLVTIVLIFFITSILICLVAILRGLPAIIGGYVFIPSARYIYPVLLPILISLNIGWLEINNQLQRWLCATSWLTVSLFLLLFLALNILTWVSISSFYKLALP